MSVSGLNSGCIVKYSSWDAGDKLQSQFGLICGIQNFKEKSQNIHSGEILQVIDSSLQLSLLHQACKIKID
jgi:hypothetical protein